MKKEQLIEIISNILIENCEMLKEWDLSSIDVANKIVDAIIKESRKEKEELKNDNKLFNEFYIPSQLANKDIFGIDDSFEK